MKKAWLWFIPLLYLPNFGLQAQTAFGNLKFIDYLIFPFAALLLKEIFKSHIRLDRGLRRFIRYFIAWASIGVFMVLVYYDYFDSWPYFLSSLAKFARFLVYASAGLLCAVALRRTENIKFFHWSVVGCLAVMAVSSTFVFWETSEFVTAYEASNQVSIVLSILIIYVMALLVSEYGDAKWRKFATIAVAMGLIGITFTGGRGGWVAFLVGSAYMVVHKKMTNTFVTYLLLIPIAGISLYTFNPRFREDIIRILNPDPKILTVHHITVLGLDDGSRLFHFKNEAPKVIRAPFFGAGFYHRGYESRLWTSGSHNFFLQMVLETGIVGFFFLVGILKRLWYNAGRSTVKYSKLSIPYRAMFITAVTGGMSGEYYYGGIAVFTFLLLYAPVGVLVSKQRSRRKVAAPYLGAPA